MEWLRGNIDELRRRRATERQWALEERRFSKAVADGLAVNGVQRDVYAHFRSAVPELADFEEVRDGLFTRPLHPEIRAVLKLAALKGASYTLCWGVSLAFAPHLTSARTSLHRDRQVVAPGPLGRRAHRARQRPLRRRPAGSRHVSVLG